MKIWSGTINYDGVGLQTVTPLFDPLRLQVAITQDVTNLHVFHGTVNKDVLNSAEAPRTYYFYNGTRYEVSINSASGFEIACFDASGNPLPDVFHPGPLDLYAY